MSMLIGSLCLKFVWDLVLLSVFISRLLICFGHIIRPSELKAGCHYCIDRQHSSLRVRVKYKMRKHRRSMHKFKKMTTLLNVLDKKFKSSFKCVCRLNSCVVKGFTHRLWSKSSFSIFSFSRFYIFSPPKKNLKKQRKKTRQA